MSENGEIYTAVNNFTLPPAVAALTNSTSVVVITVLEVFPITHLLHPVQRFAARPKKQYSHYHSDPLNT